MKNLNPKVLYLISSVCIIASIPFKANTPMLYYGLLAIGVLVFLWAATHYIRK